MVKTLQKMVIEEPTSTCKMTFMIHTKQRLFSVEKTQGSPFLLTIATKRIKYTGKYQHNETKELYTENYRH